MKIYIGIDDTDSLEIGATGQSAEQVKNMDFDNLGDDECVRMGEKVKIVLLDNKYTLMVFPTDIEAPKWQTSTTHMLRVF